MARSLCSRGRQGPARAMTSPVLVRRFLIGWFQAPFLGKPNRSRATSQLELRTSDSTGACGLVLDNPESGGASGLEVTLEVPGEGSLRTGHGDAAEGEVEGYAQVSQDPRCTGFAAGRADGSSGARPGL